MSDNGEGLNGLPDDHFVRAIGVRVTMCGDGMVRGTAAIRPELFAPGTTRVRVGVLLTMLDIVLGHVPDGAINPTVDLRLQIVGTIPVSGCIHIEARPLRVGRRLVVGEAIFADDDGNDFARGTSTFINEKVGSDILLRHHEPAAVPEGSIDGLIGPRIRDALSLELDPVPRVSNGLRGTVQGGAQGLLAELAVEHALGGGRPLEVVDLDIRYLARLQEGPLVATVDEIGQGLPPTNFRVARVALTDAGNHDRLVSYVAITCAVASDDSGRRPERVTTAV